MAFRFSLGFAGASSGKELQDGVVHREQPLGHGQADACGGEALAQREQRVRGLGAVWRPPPFGRHVPVAQKHEALHRIQRVCVLLERTDEVQDRRGGDALGFRAAALQLMSCDCHGASSSRFGTGSFGKVITQVRVPGQRSVLRYVLDYPVAYRHHWLLIVNNLNE